MGWKDVLKRIDVDVDKVCCENARLGWMEYLESEKGFWNIYLTNKEWDKTESIVRQARESIRIIEQEQDTEYSCNDLRKVIELEITDLEKELNKTTWTARNPGLPPRALGSFYLPNQLEKLKEILEEWDKEGSGLKDKLKEKEIQEDELITFS